MSTEKSFEKPLCARIILWPLAWIYGGAVSVRNMLFNCGILSSKEFDVPIISIGNITVGGTGKTPFSEFLIQSLRKDHKVGFLSRGYKRKTSGYQLAKESSTPEMVGDEPCQVKTKFPEIMVAVDSNRRRGIRKMMQEAVGRPDMIILDDAFQHRYVAPDINILLIDYNRMVTEDHLLPVGNLRENVSSIARADMVVVTKCPQNLPSIEFRIIRKNLKLFPYQNLYFTSIEYDVPRRLFTQLGREDETIEISEETSVLTVTGIAAPKPFEDYLRTKSKDVVSLNFPDHHDFKRSDMNKIKSYFNDIKSSRKVIVTTEKDAVRLKNMADFPEDLKPFVYYIPLHFKFLKDEDEDFKNKIFSYLNKNKYYSLLISRNNQKKEEEKKQNN